MPFQQSDKETNRMELQAAFNPSPLDHPPIVTLCGSTRHWPMFPIASLRETKVGNLVFSIGAATGTDDQHFGNLAPEEYFTLKDKLDRRHLWQILLSNEILVLDLAPDGARYIGASTGAEIAFASRKGKTIRYWSEEMAHVCVECPGDHPTVCHCSCTWAEL